MARKAKASQPHSTQADTFPEVVIDLAQFQPHKRNYNFHSPIQIDRLRASLRKFGQPRNIVVWRDMFVAGHGVAMAAAAEGWATLRANVIPEDWPEARVLAFLAADNELSRLSDPDQVALAALIDEARQFDPELLTAMGYNAAEFDALLESMTPAGGDEWGGAMGGLPTEDKAPFQQMTFTLHDSQAEEVRRAIAIAGKLGDFTDSANQNGNGNALAFICETFVTEHGDG